MSDLEPCPSCRRHVAITDLACPFCGAAQQASASRTIAGGRATRAAVFAGATLVTATAGCGGPKVKPVETTGSGSAMAATPDAAPAPQPDPIRPDHSQNMPYGAPPARRRIV